jgi:hypothetical protein
MGLPSGPMPAFGRWSVTVPGVVASTNCSSMSTSNRTARKAPSAAARSRVMRSGTGWLGTCSPTRR